MLLSVLDTMGRRFEIIAVDDGSSDKSASVLKAAATQRPEVKVIEFRRNAGQTAALMAGIDQPTRRNTDRFPIRRIGRLTLAGRQLWGTTGDLSEGGALFTLQEPGLGLEPGPATLELMEPPLTLEGEISWIGHNQLGVRFSQASDPMEAGLLGLIYSRRHWFHQPRRLTTSDALLHWLGTILKPDPFLRRFR